MNELMMLFTAAVLVEAIVETIKRVRSEDGIDAWMVAAFVVGIFVSVVYGLDLFGRLGFESPFLPPVAAQVVGAVLTGILFGRGANWLHDLLSRLTAASDTELYPPAVLEVRNNEIIE